MLLTERIGLFGGSFNPVHYAHLLVARAAREEYNLSRLIFIPAARSPFKESKELASGAERLRLLRLALAGSPEYQVDDQEIQRGGVSFSIDTVRNYARLFPGAPLFYLVGADQVAFLDKWRDAADLARLAEFLVIPRPGEGIPMVAPPFRVHYLEGLPFALSSSEVRRRVRSGLPIDLLTPPPVAEAIRNNGLYL